MSLFQLQLLISFLVGGSFITLIALIAERASERMAGLIITLPSTVAMSFVFIGWTIGPAQIPEVVTPIPLGIGAVLMFASTYLYLSKIKLPKITSMVLCITGAMAIWFAIMLPIAFFNVDNLTFSLAGFVILTLLGHHFMTRKNHIKSHREKNHYTSAQLLFRGAFTGGIIALTVFLAKTVGPLWAGVFSAFPAAFSSTFLILHWYYDSDFLFKTFKNAPLGNLGFLAFVLVSMWSFPNFGTLLGTLIAYTASAAIFLLIVNLEWPHRQIDARPDHPRQR